MDVKNSKVIASPTFDRFRKSRCRTFMRRLNCPRGITCKFDHKLPKEDDIICKYDISGTCVFTSTECKYKHLDSGKDLVVCPPRKDSEDVGTRQEIIIMESPDITCSVGRTILRLKQLYDDQEER